MPDALRWSVVIVDFDPVVGHEQAGQRRALVVSYEPFHRSGMAAVCPITSRPPKYPGEVAIPAGQPARRSTVSSSCTRSGRSTCGVSTFEVGGQPQSVRDPELAARSDAPSRITWAWTSRGRRRSRVVAVEPNHGASFPEIADFGHSECIWAPVFVVPRVTRYGRTRRLSRSEGGNVGQPARHSEQGLRSPRLGAADGATQAADAGGGRRSTVFASAPAPGHPFGIAVDDGRVYVSTSAGDFFAVATAPELRRRAGLRLRRGRQPRRHDRHRHRRQLGHGAVRARPRRQPGPEAPSSTSPT